MNQTVTINISGIVFHIEIDAYEELKNYLSKIKSYFKNSEESEEIMTDIEARIAELFSSKISPENQVIRSMDVEEVITIMGKPEQYVDEDEEQPKQESSSSHKKTYQTAKKLFRDPDDRTIGGVASGIAAYFGIDTIWLRLFFVIAFFVGFGFLLYVILWIVIPEAKTASDKLQMKGDPVNINNIDKTFKEKADRMSDDFKQQADKVSENLRKSGQQYGKNVETAFEAFFSFLGQVFRGVFKVLGKFFGTIFLLVGLVFLISITLWLTVGEEMIFSITDDGIFRAVKSPEFFNLIFPSTDMYYFFLLAFFLTIGIPFVVLIYAGLKLLFSIKTHFSVGLSMFVLWLIGVLSCAFLVFNIAKDQTSHDYIKQNNVLSNNFSGYHIKLLNKEMPGKIILEAKDFNITIDDDSIYTNRASINIKKSNIEEVRIQVKYTARGRSKKDARENANAITYQYNISDSIISFSDFISTPNTSNIRNQMIEATIFLPLGKVIFIDKSLKNVIYDIDNVTDTHDSKMLGKKWVMLEDGLTCLDCEKIKGITSLQLDSINAIEPIIEDIIEE